MLNILVQVRCADGGNGATGVKTDTHVLRVVESFFFNAVLRCDLRDQPFNWNDSFHRRREGAMITQRAVSVRLKKEVIQHMTDFEDMSNAFPCTSADCRAEVLEELINEMDRPMFFERVLNSTVRYDFDEGHVFATPQCGNLMGSSEGRSSSWLRMRCRLFGGTCGRWRGRRSICRHCRDRDRQDWYAIWDSLGFCR